ncbi:ABC transporter, substrate-binding protein, aliphatic sulfonates, partial [Pseudomonas syringae pv. actinidiae ICMP 18804]
MLPFFKSSLSLKSLLLATLLSVLAGQQVVAAEQAP